VNANIVIIYMFNLIFNIIGTLFDSYDGREISVKIVSRRFSRESNLPIGLSYMVIDSKAGEFKANRQFISMPKHDIRLRNIMRHIPMSHKAYQSLMSSLNIHSTLVSAVRYDIETGSLFINVPNNPSVQNTAIASRSIDTRGSENFSMTVTSV